MLLASSLFLCTCVGLTACGDGNGAGTGGDNSNQSGGSSSNNQSDGNSSSNSAGGGLSQNAGLEGAATDFFQKSEEFTDRDLKQTYEASGTITISLSQSGTKVSDASAVTVDSSVITIKKEGVYVVSGSLSDGQIKVEAPDTDKVQIVLDSATITSQSSAPIYVKTADKVFITTTKGSKNSLKTAGEFVADGDINVDGVIFSKEDLVLSGEGSLNIETSYGHGVVSKDDLKVTGGTYEIYSTDHGLAGKDSVRIAGGTIYVETEEDGIHASNTEDEEKGYVYICGGDITIVAGDDGIHGESKLEIEDGTIDITKCYEGLEAGDVLITGGDISLVASDDGINAASGSSEEGMDRPGGGWFGTGFGGFGASGNTGNQSDLPGQGEVPSQGEVPGQMGASGCRITIAGGTTYVTASGDGIDTNGALYVTGGELYVAGPENSGNGAFDYDSQAIITGGTVIATGMSGMAQTFSSGSNQGSMMLMTQTMENGEISVTVDGTKFAFSPSHSYNCVVISVPGLTVGNTYQVILGSQEKEVELTSLTYSEGGYGAGGGFGHGGGFQGGGRGPGAGGTDGFQGGGRGPGSADSFQGDDSGAGGDLP